MYEGSTVELRMEKVITLDGLLDENLYECKVHKYDVEEDYMYLEFEGNQLTSLSLDAVYNCVIHTKKEAFTCSGIIKQRFQSEEGDIAVFKIENGFYKVQGRKRKPEPRF
ncbi:MAG: hypothetical protein PHN80_04030 [Hespellia sp.]|nr:hypothetical protein [Hespellia sp.]